MVLWDTIFDRLVTLGYKNYELDIRSFDTLCEKHPEAFPKWCITNDVDISFNWNLLRWEIRKKSKRARKYEKVRTLKSSNK